MRVAIGRCTSPTATLFPEISETASTSSVKKPKGTRDSLDPVLKQDG